ncbi:bis(5'-nucleosyl)-tetraphosphatase (symmetrical) YqeK [Secundilactobacillus malefermentans]|uniref:bis(5'-nucleosyl)-tetraphosphatase (symmetrical) n=1 Tax=Secundilactobacillus malefermentans TaxID=176292 RepID=A0A4R5NP80_9LACO|nr:bis(5'-nucleosyl)-tetraphosphatase (symmetrical) YqeK [Secundilactobacillus malefermentans]QEA30722.1 HD domain-containing protein [Secundilactobacillus malefermentans]TDG78432.1 hypothetical protein C5L31_000375 [Secundilactobacillus malefermentans]
MTDSIIYHENITSYSREELLSKIKQQLHESRFKHVQRVEKTAIQLAQENDVDPEKASIAGLVHDYAKQRSDDDFRQAIVDYQLDPDLLNWGNAIWHGIVGAELIKKELKIFDEDILDAVRYHTTGSTYMTTLAKIIYMADYIEPGRNFPGVEMARKVTHDNLDDGVVYQTASTLNYLISNQKPIYPKTIETYNAWVPGASDKVKEILNG